jgi:Phage Terminase
MSPILDDMPRRFGPVFRQPLAMMLDPSMILDAIGMGTLDHPGEPQDWQRRILRSESRKLLVNVHRQGGKSTTTAGLALHTAVFHPEALVLIVSRSQRQANLLFDKVVSSYQALGRPIAATIDNAVTLGLANGSKIVSLPNDPDTIRGFSSPHLVVVDEASRVDDPVFAALKPMLTINEGKLVELSTPRGRRGHFCKMWTGGDASWERIMLRGDQNPRITPEMLEQERRDMIDWEYKQEWECEFMDTCDQLIAGDVIAGAYCSPEPPGFFSDEDLYG